jgi:disulfide bond formation protein DsbB
MNVQTLNLLLALASIVGQIGVVAMLVIAIAYPQSQTAKFIAKHALAFVTLVALGAVVTSLIYSDIIGYAPCKLCWFQRIFMYPTVLIGAVALWYKDKSALRYILTLSVVGLGIAFYHILLEHGLVPSLACGATGPSCATRYVFELGYITIPLMSFVSFALVALSSTIALRFRNENLS